MEGGANHPHGVMSSQVHAARVIVEPTKHLVEMVSCVNGGVMTTVETEIVEEMFVQVAQGASSSGGTLTLTGLSPSTLYFSDRPKRVVGHMTTEQFVDGWDVGDNSFASDPPNAVLSFVESGENRPKTASSCCATRRSTVTTSRMPSRNLKELSRFPPVRAHSSSTPRSAAFPRFGGGNAQTRSPPIRAPR